MSSGPTVSVILISTRAGDALADAVRSVVEQDYRPLELVIYGNGAPVEPPGEARREDVALRVGSGAHNLGVAGGRNAAVRESTGELLLFLDDDAILRPGAITRAVEVARAGDVGAVAFRVVDPATGSTAVWFYPRDVEKWGEQPFDATSVVGGGNLIRRECFERLGGFWDGYFREMEEIDFSWRLLDAGWRIRYEPLAVFEHEERTKRLYAHAVPSNLLMLWRLLPPGLALRQSAVKLPLFAVRALRHGELRELGQGLARAARALPRVLRDRAPLRPATVELLRRAHAAGGWGKRLQWSLRRR